MSRSISGFKLCATVSSNKNSGAGITPRKGRLYRLGEPGPTIQQVWLCLHGHGQPVPNLASQLVRLHTPEQLLILPEALLPAVAPTRFSSKSGEGSVWFRQASIGPDLALVRTYLDELAHSVLAACLPGTRLAILGYGYGATAVSVWLASNGFPCEQLILYAPIFPPEINRPRLFTDLPPVPVTVLNHTDTLPYSGINGVELVNDLVQAGLRAKLHLVEQSPLPLAVLKSF